MAEKSQIKINWLALYIEKIVPFLVSGTFIVVIWIAGLLFSMERRLTVLEINQSHMKPANELVTRNEFRELERAMIRIETVLNLRSNKE